jgi:Protein of unknown function (DUF3426)
MSSDSPSFTKPAARPVKPIKPWRWIILAAAMGLGLLLHMIIADRARLATDPAWRPRLEAICHVLQCSLPVWHEPSAFRVSTRDIRPHPSVPNALLLSASFRNDAQFAQAWPQLEVALVDLEEQALGLRRFQVREYLGKEPNSKLIMPGQSANLTLEILDPGKRAVAFRLEFH